MASHSLLASPDARAALRRSVVLVPAVAGLVALRKWWLAPFHAYQPAPPKLAGFRHVFYTASGPVTVRLRPGRRGARVVVLVHGWGASADSAWWRVLNELDAADPGGELSVVAMDLPGHGLSPDLDAEFTVDLAARAVSDLVDVVAGHFEVSEVGLVGVSMGGPVCLSAARLRSGLSPDRPRVSSLVVVASSAFWDPLSVQALTFLGPWLMDERSPVASVVKRRRLTSASELASAYAWGFLLRPSKRILLEAARSLRRFDARGWVKDELPPVFWVVTLDDRIVPSSVQLASADLLASEVEVVEAAHSVGFTHPDVLAELILRHFQA